jgi:hypothetical protein
MIGEGAPFLVGKVESVSVVKCQRFFLILPFHSSYGSGW